MTPIPTEQTEVTSQEVRPVGNKPSISMAVAERAAREAGFNVIDAKQLKAAGVFGEFVSQVGAIHLGRSRLAMNLARTEASVRVIDSPSIVATQLKHILEKHHLLHDPAIPRRSTFQVTGTDITGVAKTRGNWGRPGAGKIRRRVYPRRMSWDIFRGWGQPRSRAG